MRRVRHSVETTGAGTGTRRTATPLTRAGRGIERVRLVGARAEASRARTLLMVARTGTTRTAGTARGARSTRRTRARQAWSRGVASRAGASLFAPRWLASCGINSNQVTRLDMSL